jgi:mono/diheme cytochrome c family protein
MRQVTAGLKVVAGFGILVAAGGAIAQAQPADDAALLATLMDQGEPIFNRICTVCHGAEGGGGEGPAFVGNGALASLSTIMDQVIRGGAYMPAFGGALSDAEIAAVATFIRNSFGNSFGVVTAEQVAGYR